MTGSTEWPLPKRLMSPPLATPSAISAAACRMLSPETCLDVIGQRPCHLAK